MSEFIIALGLVAVIEGLVIALAPNYYKDIIEFLESLSKDQRRLFGLGFVALGVIVIWIVKA